MQFCGKCGTSLKPAAVSDRAVLRSERRQITALFADLSGYTTMTDSIDPEEVREITGRIFQGAAEIVAGYDGVIENFAGDGMLVLFGIPKSHGDDPLRAIHSARKIHQLVTAMNPRYESRIGSRLAMHSGISTGLVVIEEMSDPAGNHHGVTGEVINMASRLSDLARPHEIIVSLNTYRACRNHFSFQPLQQTRLRGKSGQISIYRLVSTKVSKLFNVRPERPQGSGIVGRDWELKKIEKLILDAIRGRGAVINVLGEAGIGKSRLIAELKEWPVMQQVTLLEGQAISIGKNLSFHPVIDILKSWAAITDNDADMLAFAKLDKMIRRVCPEESDEILPFVAMLMGLKPVGRHRERVHGISGDGLEKLILKSMRELVARGSELRPVIIIIEDLHWADASSIRLLKSLYRLAENHRVTFINLFRPGYLDSDTGELETLRGMLPPNHYLELFLFPLNDDDSRKLIDNLLESRTIPRTVKNRIVEQSGGNPFFIEEVVRSLVDDENGAFRTVQDEAFSPNFSPVIPPTINDVLIARLDRLEPESRELLKIASVVGRNFFDRVLREVADSIDDFDECLKQLKAAQLINERIRQQELEYQFKHALVQEAAYGTTLISQRRELHLKVAGSIEKLFRERLHEFYGILAYHYNQAEEPQKTEEYLIRAGQESLRVSASREALVYFQKALKLFLDKHGDSADLQKLVALERNIALALCQKGLLVEGLKYYDRILERLEGDKSPAKDRRSGKIGFGADLLRVVGGLYLSPQKVKRDPDQREKEIFETTMKRNETLVIADTERAFSSMIRLLRRAGRFDLTKTASGFRLWVGTGTVFSYMGISFAIARKFLARAETMVDHNRVRDAIAYHNSWAMYRHCAGSWRGMPEYDEPLVDRCLRAGAMFYIVPYSWSIGQIKVEQGDFAAAEAIIAKLFKIAETYDHYQARLVALGLQSHLMFKLRNFPAAEKTADQRFSLAGELGVTIGQMAALGHKIMIKAWLGNVDAATALIARAESTISGCGRLPPYCLARYQTGRFINDMNILRKALSSGHPARVRECRRKTRRSGRRAVASARCYAPSRTLILKLTGDYRWLVSQPDKAMKSWHRAIAEGERMGARPDLARTCFEVGRRLRDPLSPCRKLDGIDAEGYLDKAEGMFAEMGLGWDLAELQQFRSGPTLH